jgi:hypothetical protein
MAALCLNLPPEGVDAGVPLVRNLLEGLVGLPSHDVEARVRDVGGDSSTKARWQDDVEFADRMSVGAAISARRSAVSCAMHTSTCALKGLDGLLVWNARASSTIWSTEPSACACGV